MDNIKTFEFHSDSEVYTCCIAKGEDNAIWFYFLNDDGYWEDLLDATAVPDKCIFVPEGYVCIKNDCENRGVLDALVGMCIVHAPICSVPSGMGTLHLEMCEVNQKVLDEWDAGKILFNEN